MTTQRVLIFAAYFYPDLGGYAKSIYELSRRMAETGYEIDVITCNTKKTSVEEEIDGIYIHRLPCWNIWGGIYPIPKPTVRTFNILFRLARKRFDLISTQTRFFLTSLLGLIFSRIKRKPLVHTEHGTRHSVLPNRLVEFLVRILDHTVGSLIVKSAARNIGVSKAACDFLKHLGAKNTIVIHNGIDTDVYRMVRTDLTKRLELSDAIIIVFLGRLIYAKGVQDLISAFPIVKNAIPKIKLLVVGDGPYRWQLQKLASRTDYSGDIKFLGLKSDDEIIEILSVADVFVNPSYSEGLPTSVLEAAAIGVPIVATDVGGTREIIEHGKIGLLINEREPRQIAEAVTLLKGNKQTAKKNLATKLGRAARLKVINDYSWENAVKRTMQVWQEVL